MAGSFYALQERVVARFVEDVSKITDGRMTRMWPWMYRTIAGFAPRPLLTATGGVAHQPYTVVSYHTGPALGWKDFDPEQPPAWGDPRLNWIMRHMVLESAECVFMPRDSRLFATFCIWLPEHRMVGGAAETEQWELYQNRIFYNRDPFPEPFGFLDAEGYRAYIPHDELVSLVETERRTGLLRNSAQRVDASDANPFAAQELRRLAAFMEYAVADGSALLYHEAAT